MFFFFKLFLGRNSQVISIEKAEIIEPKLSKSRMSLTTREMAANFCKEYNLDSSTSSDSNSIKMRLSDVNIKRRSIITSYAYAKENDDLNKISNRKSVTMNISVAKPNEVEIEIASNNRNTIYSAAPMNITLADSQLKDISTDSYEIVKPLLVSNRKTICSEEPMNVTLAVNHSDTELFDKKLIKTIILQETMNLCENSNEKENVISEVVKRKSIYVHEPMNVTGCNDSRKSCINLSKVKRITIHTHESMNMTEMANDFVEDSVILDETPMINPGKFVKMLFYKEKCLLIKT